MKTRVILGFFLLTVLAPLAGRADAPSASTALPALKAIVPDDNDITPDEDDSPATEVVPTPVSDAINSVVATAYDDFIHSGLKCSVGKCAPAESTFYGRIYHLYAPMRRQLYVFVLNNPNPQTQYLFWLYDPEKQRITQKPISMYGRWLDDFSRHGPLTLEAPFVSYTRAGKETLLTVETYGHNGNAYNAVIYRYFSLGTDLSLNPVAALEAQAVWSFSPDDDSNGKLLRDIKFKDDKSATITTYLQPFDPKFPRRLVGIVEIGAASYGLAFKVISASSHEPPPLGGALITANGDDDDNDFLANGDLTAY